MSFWKLFSRNFGVLGSYFWPFSQSLNESGVEERAQATQLFQVRQAMIERLKRCCMAYMHERMMRLKNMKWKLGGGFSPEMLANMSAEEKVWLKDYTGCLFVFQQNVGVEEGDEDPVDGGVNLTTAMYPPKTTLAQVRVLKEYGDFETSDGVRLILRNKTLVRLPAHCFIRFFSILAQHSADRHRNSGPQEHHQPDGGAALTRRQAPSFTRLYSTVYTCFPKIPTPPTSNCKTASALRVRGGRVVDEVFDELDGALVAEDGHVVRVVNFVHGDLKV